ncbi:T9SS type A sorting domain-containing protein [candidate division KSB1 bacterium]|nr:T9SS type A sorting domain-containing protein [candidate division KSB1 bacterium]
MQQNVPFTGIICINTIYYKRTFSPEHGFTRRYNMNKWVTITLIFLLSVGGLAQQAIDYFHSEIGATMTYKIVPLDSLGNPIADSTIYERDLYAAVGDVEGKTAHFLLIKTGPKATLDAQAYRDTLYYNFEGSVTSQYLDLAYIESIMGQFSGAKLDSALGDFDLMAFLKALEKWYPMFDYQAPLEQEAIMFQRDTTLTLPGLPFPLTFRLQATNKRVADETITTELGTFDCKKFVQSLALGIVSPLPPYAFTPLAELPEAIWIAEDNWIVRSRIAPVEIDLTLLGEGVIKINGLLREAIPTTAEKVKRDKTFAEKFDLLQNYPNPFNASTTIRYHLKNAAEVRLEIYDMIGRNIATLVNDAQAAGEYSINYQADYLPSGVYYYKLTAGNYVKTKKMILLK